MISVPCSRSPTIIASDGPASKILYVVISGLVGRILNKGEEFNPMASVLDCSGATSVSKVLRGLIRALLAAPPANKLLSGAPSA